MSRNVLILTLVLLLASPAMAGTQADPEVVDPAGDQSETDPGVGDTNGVPGGEDHDFSDIDVIGAWIAPLDNETISVFVETEVAVQSNSQLTTSFKVEAGPTSSFGSTASGQSYSIVSNGASLSSGPATAISQAGTILQYDVPLASIGAVGGDVITELAVSSTRSESAGCLVLCEAQTGTDTAPSTGTARAYTLPRSPIFGAATLVGMGGEITETVEVTPSNSTGNESADPTMEIQTRSFGGLSVTTMDVNASIVYTLKLTNTGTDSDSYNLSLLGEDYLTNNNITALLSNATAALDPGQSLEFQVTATMSMTAVGDYAIVVSAESTNGANAIAAPSITVDAPPTPVDNTPPGGSAGNGTTGRSPLIGGGTVLEEWAESLGFVDIFGDAAELVLIAIAVLLLILIVFLIFILAGGSWIRVQVTPKNAVVGPGETAEFQVEVRNKKRRFHDALAYFEGDNNWKTGVLLKQDQGTSVSPLTSIGDEAEFSMGARREPGDHLTGTLRVQAPMDAGDNEKDKVKLNIVPLRADGRRRMRKGGKAKVTVKASNPGAEAPSRAAASGDVPVRLSQVTHEPHEPEPGSAVTTTATLENDSDSETYHLRVVLRLDGTDTAEETVVLPPRSARAVIFPWQAGDGANRVRVQVFEA